MGNRRGQTVVETAILFAVVVVVFLITQHLFRRAAESRVWTTSQSLSPEQFAAADTKYKMKVNSDSDERQVLLNSGEESTTGQTDSVTTRKYDEYTVGVKGSVKDSLFSQQP